MKDGIERLEGDISARIKITLTRLFDECLPTDPLAPYQARIREWATSYLTAPHPELGREGPVCPFTAASMRQETFWVGCVARSDLAEEDIESIIASTITKFRHLPPVNEPEALLKTILVLFPAVTDLTLINEAQRRLKERSIAMGLMIGQFYPGCEEPGVRNPEFKPLQSPLPLLAIRYMVGSDLPFLVAKSAWVEEYLKKFASSIPATARSMIATKFVVPNVEEPDNQGMNH